MVTQRKERDKMIKYNGYLKSKRQALQWSEKLENIDTKTSHAMASMLRNNWQYIAARPDLQPEIIAMMECEPLNMNRAGSVMNKILNK